MVSDELVLKLSRAIAAAEGFGKAGTVPTRARNPGDLTDDGNLGHGVIRTSGPFGAAITIYATDVDGWNALYRKVRRMLSGASKTYLLSMTIEQVAIKWSGDRNWGINVARALEVATSTSILDIVNTDLKLQATENGPQDA